MRHFAILCIITFSSEDDAASVSTGAAGCSGSLGTSAAGSAGALAGSADDNSTGAAGVVGSGCPSRGRA